MLPFEALYERPCRTPLSWENLEDQIIVGPELIQEMEDQVKLIRQRLKEAQDRQKSYADAHRTNRSYVVGDQVFIRIRPNKSTIRFGKGTKLSPRFIGPFEVLEKVGPVAIVLHCHPTCTKFIMYFMYPPYDIILLINLMTFNGRNCRYQTREPSRSNHYVYWNVGFDSLGTI